MRNGHVCVVLLLLMLAFSGSLMALEPARPPVQLTGVSQFVGWAVRTGEVVSPPDINFCPIVEARLTFGPGFLARLYTKESCGGGYVLRDMNWHVVFDRSGKLAMKLPKFATQTYSDGTVETIEVLPTMREHTGCPLNGTMPIYYGHFDGTFFHASGLFQGICDGGTLWGPLFGVSEALGPVHADFLISLEVSK